MTIIVSNQKPAVLDPLHLIPCTGDYDPMAAIQATLVDPLTEPLNPSAPASITNSRGVDLSGDILALIMDCLGVNAAPVSEQTAKELLGQTMVNYDRKTPLPVGELFASQAGHRNKLPAPGPTVLYTAQDDVIPAAKGLLAGSADESLFFASVAYAYHPNTLGFWFESSSAFDAFKGWLAQQTSLMAQALPHDTHKLLGDFANLPLKGLTESLLLRKDDADGNEEHSFARMIIHMLMSYVEQQRQAVAQPGTSQGSHMTVGIMPFTAGELFCPRSLVLVNVEAHAHATPNKVSSEWKLINQSLASPVKVVSNKALSKLTTLPRAAARAAAAAAKNENRAAARSARVKFRKQPPSKLDLLKDLTKVLHRMGAVNRSQNIFRKSRTSFAKANRRNPDDYNKPGRITSVHYMPDLHVYVDTSGSISEENYQEAVMMLIHIAKKLNVNLYFNSFSHVLSQEVMLKVENRSVQQIWQEFSKVPKVTGGTDYLQIWNHVNANPARRQRLSLVITDFEWFPPSTREEHPKNLYYAPCSAMDWNAMVQSAQRYAKQMHHIDPSIKQRLLGMIV